MSSTTLLLGKLSGVGAAGLTQVLAWALSLLGVSLAAVAPIGSFSMPEVTPLMLISFVVFFVLGFLFYAALYAAIGAAVNTVQEAQRLAFPVMTPIILAMISFPAVLEAPALELGDMVDARAGDTSLPLIPVKVPIALTPAAKQIASWRFGVDWGEVDYVARAGEFTTPMLVIHGPDDDTVPFEVSEEVAAAAAPGRRSASTLLAMRVWASFLIWLSIAGPRSCFGKRAIIAGSRRSRDWRFGIGDW